MPYGVSEKKTRRKGKIHKKTSAEGLVFENRRGRISNWKILSSRSVYALLPHGTADSAGDFLNSSLF